MKRIFLLLISLFLFLRPLPALSASAAQEPYAYVPDGDVWFYAGETESSRVFLLPKTYYVRILSTGEQFCRVEYLLDDGLYRKVTGYCKTEDIIPVDYIPSRPYLRKEITLSYSLPTAGGTGSGLGGAFASVERTFVYYGQRYDGAKLYYYVLSDGTFDYIPAEEELAYELNTDYLDYVASKETAGTGGTVADPPEGMNAAVIVVICVACAAAVAVAVFVVKGKKAPIQDDAMEE